MPDPQLANLLDDSIATFLRGGLRFVWNKPVVLISALRTLRHQRLAAGRRHKWRGRGLAVPPVMILSVTKGCNLRCKGCYAMALHGPGSQSLSEERLDSLLDEARELGIGIVLLAGGEPLTFKDLLGATARHPEIVFPLFTNGTLLTPSAVAHIKGQRHVVPVISIEGDREETDGRRGPGVFDRIESAMSLLRKSNVFFGCSITLTRRNFHIVFSPDWVGSMRKKGCRLFFYVSYVPVEKETEDLTLTDEQIPQIAPLIARLRDTQPALYQAFPSEDDCFGGCLAAGRGFVHVNTTGDLEPCPFSPHADRNISELSLAIALRSPLLEKIRSHPSILQETRSGCPLWANREWVESQAECAGHPSNLPATGNNHIPALPC